MDENSQVCASSAGEGTRHGPETARKEADVNNGSEQIDCLLTGLMYGGIAVAGVNDDAVFVRAF